MAKKLALGKGIASLIQTTTDTDIESNQTVISSEVNKEQSSATGNGMFYVKLNEIKINPNQPRKIFKEKELEELADSIRENGIIQPLIVSKESDGTYELIAGERRLRAAKRADLKTVPAVVKKATERDRMIMSVIENVQRMDLNCVEEALAYYQLMDDYKLNQGELAQKLGKERSSLANYLRILKLPRKVIEMIQRDELSFGHAKVLAAITDQEECIGYSTRVVAGKLSVRDLEKMIKTKKLSRKSPQTNPFFDEKLDAFRKTLEQKTGFHFNIKSRRNGAGQITLKYNNEAEFNDIYEFLTKR